MKQQTMAVLAAAWLTSTSSWAVGGTQVHEAPIGSKVSGIISIGHNQLVLPEGEFEVAAIHNYTVGNEANKVSQVYLVQREGQTVRAYLRLFATVEHTRGISDWRNEPCKRGDYLFKQDKSSSVKRQECLWVNHHTNVMVRPNSNQKAPWDFHLYLQQHQLKIPSTMLSANYMRYVPSQMVSSEYMFNPELAGFPPEAPAAWQMSAWHKDATAKDERRQALVKGLSDWLVNTAATENDAGFDKAEARPVRGPDLSRL